MLGKKWVSPLPAYNLEYIPYKDKYYKPCLCTVFCFFFHSRFSFSLIFHFSFLSPSYSLHSFSPSSSGVFSLSHNIFVTFLFVLLFLFNPHHPPFLSYSVSVLMSPFSFLFLKFILFSFLFLFILFFHPINYISLISIYLSHSYSSSSFTPSLSHFHLTI